MTSDSIPALFLFVNVRRRRKGWTETLVGVAFFGESRCLAEKCREWAGGVRPSDYVAG